MRYRQPEPDPPDRTDLEAPEVSVVLPAYNEAETIERTIAVTRETLAEFLPKGGFDIIVAEDGCDDRTPEIASRIASEDPRVRHFHSDERLGRGGALKRAFQEGDGDVLVYFDTDLATDLHHLEELVESVRSAEYDVVTGSRLLPENMADRPLKRQVFSQGYNGLVRLFLRSDLRDHQCGFKAFDRDVMLELLDDVKGDHWFWDTEVLVRAQQRYDVKEFPVDWEPKGDSKVDITRDVFGMGSQIFRLWWERSVSPRVTARTKSITGILATVGLFLLAGMFLDPMVLLETVRSADAGLVSLGASAYFLSWPIRGLRYRDILAKLDFSERTGFLTGAVFISQTGNLVFPARAGDGIRAYILKARRNIPYSSGFASLAIERVFDLLVITVMAGVMFGVLALGGTDVSVFWAGDATGGASTTGETGRTALVAAAAVAVGTLATVAGLVTTARSDRNYVHRTIGRISGGPSVESLRDAIEGFVSDLQLIARDRGAFVRVGLLSAVIWTIDVLTALLVFVAFGVNLPLWMLLAVGFFAVSVGNLAKVLPLTPGGVGLYEGAFAFIIVALTPVGWSVALAAAVVDHAVKNFVTLAGGVGSTLLFNVSLVTAVKEGREVASESADREDESTDIPASRSVGDR
ncbi:flippase-like domain-containing protein [Natrinema salsiterrestre]|uniref:Flippase-like domain-containing protein n=1 Tax=Natrinema salsiterrestre TaxID=2950540 RepID=A0A9Q4KZ37_9EURY|nr:flippase-like domain-containing protein [Natrinema salsiterrestre]MDF9746755.1 flippase-like domain-containing protein [Natrinema salsiterrestre]